MTLKLWINTSKSYTTNLKHSKRIHHSSRTQVAVRMKQIMKVSIIPQRIMTSLTYKSKLRSLINLLWTIAALPLPHRSRKTLLLWLMVRLPHSLLSKILLMMRKTLVWDNKLKLKLPHKTTIQWNQFQKSLNKKTNFALRRKLNQTLRMS